jgi:peptidoglycan/xylan/chitin deacetylase (PgdA/CDA1 family)
MGTVVLSLDAELAWGYHDIDPLPTGKFADARESWEWLVDAFEEYSIPATWAIVGHLFLRECDGTHAHPAASDGWFRRDPGGTTDDHPLWFGPDLVRSVLDSPVDHEIASHSLSHVEFGDEATTRAVAEAEVRACVDIAKEWGIDLESFVFPRNRVGHRDVLAEYGFRNYRSRGQRWFSGRQFDQAGKALDYALGLTAPDVTPPSLDEHGLVRHAGSQYLFAFEDPARSLLSPFSREPVVRQVEKGLDRAVETDRVFHLWFHPNELRSSGDYQRVRKALEVIDRRRGDVEVATMAEVGCRVRGEHE